MPVAAKQKIEGFIIPPVDKDPFRCERAYDGNTIGQANGVTGDKGLDLRECNLSKASFTEVNFAGAVMFDANFSEANLEAAIISKAYSVGSNFTGASLKNAILDRTDFSNADFTNADLTNAVITGSNFTGANLKGTIMEDAVLGQEDVKRFCKNPTLGSDNALMLGCKRSR